MEILLILVLLFTSTSFLTFLTHYLVELLTFRSEVKSAFNIHHFPTKTPLYIVKHTLCNGDVKYSFKQRFSKFLPYFYCDHYWNTEEEVLNIKHEHDNMLTHIRGSKIKFTESYKYSANTHKQTENACKSE